VCLLAQPVLLRLFQAIEVQPLHLAVVQLPKVPLLPDPLHGEAHCPEGSVAAPLQVRAAGRQFWQVVLQPIGQVEGLQFAVGAQGTVLPPSQRPRQVTHVLATAHEQEGRFLFGGGGQELPDLGGQQLRVHAFQPHYY